MAPSGYTKLPEDTDELENSLPGCQRRSAGRKQGGYERLPGDVDTQTRDDSPPHASDGFGDGRAVRSPGHRRPPMLTMMEAADEESCNSTPLSPQQMQALEFKLQISGIEHVHASEFARRSPVSIVAEGLKQQLANIVSAEPAEGCPATLAVAPAPGSPAATQDLQAAKVRLHSAAQVAASTLRAKLTTGSPLAAKLAGSSVRSSENVSGELRRNSNQRVDVQTGNVSAHVGPDEKWDSLSPTAVVVGCRSVADLLRETGQSDPGHLHSIALF